MIKTQNGLFIFIKLFHENLGKKIAKHANMTCRKN